MAKGIAASALICSLAVLAVSCASVRPAYTEQSPVMGLRNALTQADRSLCRTLHKQRCQPPPAAKSTAADFGPVPIPRESPFRQPAAAPAQPPVPIPRTKPPLEAVDPVTQATAVPKADSPPAVAPRVLPPVKGEECLAALRAMAAEFSRAAIPAGAGACVIETPVTLTAVRRAKGTITFPEKPLLSCGFARQLANWVQGADSTAPIARMWTGPGFQCRGRNGDASAKLSEHAYGDAVDITMLETTAGRTIEVSDAASPAAADYALLKALRASACSYFTTVLGPGANAAHARHFHVDLMQRKGGYRICE